jgi:hypothetical protein
MQFRQNPPSHDSDQGKAMIYSDRVVTQVRPLIQLNKGGGR